MYSDWSVFAIGAVTTVFIWLLVLTYLIGRQNNFLKSLFPKSGERDIRQKFEEVLNQIEEFKLGSDDFRKKLNNFEKEGLGYIQRIELLRYNPYEDTGGDQSFTLAMLNEEGSGIVLTSLHARSGTRIFAKPVTEGRASKYQFSEEEETVIRRALQNGQSY